MRRAARKISKIVSNLSKRSSKTLVVFDLFDNAAYASGSGGHATNHHIRGPVKIAENQQLGRAIMDANPLLEAAGEEAKVILAPLPRYVSGPCCRDPAHCTNISSSSYRDTLKKDLANTARYIRDVINNNGIRRHRVINLTNTLMDVPIEVAWEKNPLNPTRKGYKTILDVVLAEAGPILAKKRTRSEMDPEPLERTRNRHQSEPSPERSRRPGHSAEPRDRRRREDHSASSTHLDRSRDRR